MLKQILAKKPFSGFTLLFSLQMICLLFLAVSVLRFNLLDDNAQSRALRQALYSSHDLAYEAGHLASLLNGLQISPQLTDSSRYLARFESQQQRLLKTLLDNQGWLIPRSLVNPDAESLRQAVESGLVAALNAGRKLLAVQRSLEQLHSQNAPDDAVQLMQQRWHQLKEQHRERARISQRALHDFIVHLNSLDQQLVAAEQQKKSELIDQSTLALLILLLLHLAIWLTRYQYLQRFGHFCQQLEALVQTGFKSAPEKDVFKRTEQLQQGLVRTLQLQADELKKQHWKNIALDAAGEGVLIADLTGTIEYTNIAFSEITGYDASEVLGRNCNVLSSGQTPKSVHQELWRCIRSQGSWHGELINQRKDGTLYTQMTSIAGLYNDSGDDSNAQLQGYVAIMRDISVRKQMEQELKTLAREDGLTGILNRKTVLDEARRSVQWAQRYSDPLAVVILDIDHFKAINDQWGHPVGDKAIVQVAHLCQSVLPDKALFGRIGGEEFLLVLPGMDGQSALDFAEKLREVIAESVVCVSREAPRQTVHLTCSFGVSSIRGNRPGSRQVRSQSDAGGYAQRGRPSEVLQPGDRLATLIAEADRALYRAKSLGRNRVCPALTDSGEQVSTA